MKEHKYARKLETTGRIMIPSKIREKVGLVPGKEYAFSLLKRDGRMFICIDCGDVPDELTQAVQLIEKNGMKVVKK
jgi:bifunctional DNA-binding transcriptional regulator/antitoxin component of YhaV-PrlF toxin-antitoxin module